MTCVSCMVRIARQTTFFLFPILIIPVLGMESSRRDPRPPPPYPPPSMQVLTPRMTSPPTISRYRAWMSSRYPRNCPVCAILPYPDITHTRRSWHRVGMPILECPICPYLSPHKARLRDTEKDSTAPHIYGPYHSIYAISRPTERKSKR